MANLNSRIQVPEDVLFCDLGEEGVLLNQKQGLYYGLDDVSTRMWSLLVQHGRLAPVASALREEYAAEDETIVRDLLRFVDELASFELLSVVET